MPDSGNDGDASRFLTMELDELADILRNNRTQDGSFVIQDQIDPRQLSQSQRDQLRGRIKEAIAIVTAGSNNVETGDLFARLQNVAVNADGTAALDSLPQFQEDGGLNTRRSSSTESIYSDNFSFVTHVDDECFCRSQLELYGGRPACSIETWKHIIEHPESSSAVLWPWLLDLDAAEKKSVEIRRENSLSIVFSQQLTRWWEFEKWQWMNRDASAGSDEAPFARYLESRRACYEHSNNRKATARDDFEATTRSLWDGVLAGYEPPYGQHNFTSYHRYLKKVLAPYPFAKWLQLRRDPRKQTVWTTWLEYLGYELWWLDNKTYAVELKERRYRDAWAKFLQDASEIERKRVVSWNPELWQPVKSLTEATDYLQKAETAIFTFVKQTSHYRGRNRRAEQQRARVDWIVEEARVMIEETKQKSQKRKRGHLSENNPDGHLPENSPDKSPAQLTPMDNQRPKMQRANERRRSTRSAVQYTNARQTRQSGRLRRVKA